LLNIPGRQGRELRLKLLKTTFKALVQRLDAIESKVLEQCKDFFFSGMTLSN
jgi:hypothetical protein